MNENLTNAQNIANIVAQEVELMSALVQLLKKEEEVLVDNTPDKLETIVLEKNTLLTQIIALEKNRNSSLSQSGLSPDAEGMNLLFSQLSTSSDVQNNWERLLNLSSAAKENNRTNGILINRHMVRNQTTLNILQQNDQTASVYGADGQSRVNSNSGRGIIAG
ncbi:flagellar protein FlgN [Undibacterium sp. LX40W]|uniref:Flagellar protein FlgN n=1 Tax=Undibacterium nitidum TaxID=2762298 RepID=A0A923HI01_9BURK|nr:MULTISPECIES: flagellar protein FlgN [Undibacterium]MBC3880150.1 flagellar protein FlgN [Undibacterium nitidum]MBC3891114.1 flagellar protein FlgN [Undibacterium sp. LX40W]